MGTLLRSICPIQGPSGQCPCPDSLQTETTLPERPWHQGPEEMERGEAKVEERKAKDSRGGEYRGWDVIRGTAVWMQNVWRKTSGEQCWRERMAEKKKMEAGGPGLTQAPRLGSSIVFPNCLSITDYNDVYGESFAPTEDTSNMFLWAGLNPREIKEILNKLMGAKRKHKFSCTCIWCNIEM